MVRGPRFLPTRERTLKISNGVQFSSVTQSCPTLCDPWTAACQASLSITNSRSLLKLMSIESGMPSNHLSLCCPLLLLPSIFPSIRVFFNESVLCIRWPKYWISPKKTSHVQRQRRSPSKMVGGAKSCLESNPIPARDTWRAKTKPCVHQDPETTQRLSQTCVSVSCRGMGEQWSAAGAGALGEATWVTHPVV